MKRDDDRAFAEKLVVTAAVLGVTVSSLDGKLTLPLKSEFDSVMSGWLLLLFVVGLLMALCGYLFQSSDSPGWDVWQDWLMFCGGALAVIMVVVGMAH